MHRDQPGADLQDLLHRFAAAHAALPPGDDARYFCGTYLRSTLAMRDELGRGGFADPDWVRRTTVAFATRYLDALANRRAGDTGAVPPPWRAAFGVAAGAPPVVHLLVGLHAHLNHDLPLVLLDVLSDAEFLDGRVLAARHADFRHIDTVMVRRIPPEYRELRAAAGPGRRAPALLLYPVNLLTSRRWLVRARRSVWDNARELSAARTRGPAHLALRVRELEDLCAAAVADLGRPGPVLLRAAVRGFGVHLPPGERDAVRRGAPARAAGMPGGHRASA
ncbi:hypothetical protein NUM3379_39250 [Kineococcus sp. NUM-3379]